MIHGQRERFTGPRGSAAEAAGGGAGGAGENAGVVLKEGGAAGEVGASMSRGVGWRCRRCGGAQAVAVSGQRLSAVTVRRSGAAGVVEGYSCEEGAGERGAWWTRGRADDEEAKGVGQGNATSLGGDEAPPSSGKTTYRWANWLKTGAEAGRRAGLWKAALSRRTP